nr:NS2 [Mute swan feces associated ambidensovirus 1]
METLKNILEWIVDAVVEIRPTTICPISINYWVKLSQYLETMKYRVDKYPDLGAMIESVVEVVQYIKNNQTPENSNQSFKDYLELCSGPLEGTLAMCFNAIHKQKLKDSVVSFEMMHSTDTEEDFSSSLEMAPIATSSISATSTQATAGVRSSKKRKAEQSLEDLIANIGENTQETLPVQTYPAFSSISSQKAGNQKTYSLYRDEWKDFQVKISLYPSKNIKNLPEGKNSTRWKHASLSLTSNFSRLSKSEILLTKFIDHAVKEILLKEKVVKPKYNDA